MYNKLLEVLVAVGLIAGAWWYSGHSAVERYKAEQVVKQAKANAEQQTRYDKLASEYEELKLKRQDNARVITKNVDRIVEKPIYVESCWELNGLLNANASIRGDSGVAESTVQKASGD